MDIDKAKLIRIAAITSISLALMLAGQWIYTKYTLDESLVKVISQKPGVEKADIRSERGKIVVSVKLKDIGNFMEVYDDLHDTLSYNLKDKPFSIVLTNQPDNAIRDAYENHIQYIVYEALQTGNYTVMKDKLDEIGSQKEIDINSYINQKNIYIKLKHENHYFYYIIKRAD